MKSVNQWLFNPDLLKQETAKLNKYIDKFNAELLEYRRRRTLEIVEEILNDKALPRF